MEQISQKDIDWLLNKESFAIEGKSSSDITPTAPKERVKKKRTFLGLLTKLIGLVLLLVLPFFLLIRTSVYLNITHGYNGWLALTGGILLTSFILLLYQLILFRRAKHKKRVAKISGSIASIMVGGFCLYAVFYLSGVHAKSEEVRAVYRSLHPILRVAVATTTLADNSLVITDIKRTEEDYAKMGIPLNRASMHYEQSNGFVHAIDLRTKGRSEFRNKSIEYALKAVGLKTLRHVGTADHLHVALPLSHNR